MALSPNYSWAEPDNSSLVKNGAADIRTLGDAIDTSVWNVGFGQAGKNKIINGDFGIWQRGTLFSTSGVYTADRFQLNFDTTGASVSRQSFTAGTAPVAGYEGQFFMRLTRGTSGSFVSTQQRIEDVRTFAGQTVTLSFWAKASASCTITPAWNQNFGSGGSGEVSLTLAATTLTTSWVRYSYTTTITSVSGKTIGAGSYLSILAQRITSATNVDVDMWGLQLEAGSKATPFQTATGTIQGELAACQRYYVRQGGQTIYQRLASGAFSSTTNAFIQFPQPVTMRVAPTSVEFSTMALNDYTSTLAVTSVSIDFAGGSMTSLTCGVASGGTQYRPAQLLTNNSTSAYVALSAEL